MFEQPSPDLASVIGAIHRRQAEQDDGIARFARDVHAGLSSRPRVLDSQYLYDSRGSELFEQICVQPEYYPTRTEAAILRKRSGEIAQQTGPVTVVELGAGTSAKTEHLLRAYHSADCLHGYVAVDVSDSALRKGRETIHAALPEVDSHMLCATYDAAFSAVGQLGRTMLVFLGSTIGNFPPEAMDEFFSQVAESLGRGEFFLLGVDLHKETTVLEAAYNDAKGVTAAFTLNLFARMNRELGADIDLSAVQHRAHYNVERRQIEICAEFTRPQAVHVQPLGVVHGIAAGERIWTEVSRKFTIEQLSLHVAPFGLTTRRVFSDDSDRYALVLFERTLP